MASRGRGAHGHGGPPTHGHGGPPTHGHGGPPTHGHGAHGHGGPPTHGHGAHGHGAHGHGAHAPAPSSRKPRTPHPNQQPRNKTQHVNFSTGSQLLDLLKTTAAASGNQDLQKAYDYLKHSHMPSMNIPTQNEEQFQKDFKKYGIKEIDPAEIKAALEESGDITLENPIDIITDADKLSKDRTKLAELNKEYISIMDSLNMPKSFYQ